MCPRTRDERVAQLYKERSAMELDHFLISGGEETNRREISKVNGPIIRGWIFIRQPLESGGKGTRRTLARFAPSSLCFETHAAPLKPALSEKKHLTTSGGAYLPTCIPVAGESSQVPEQMGAVSTTRESVIKAVYLGKCGLPARTNARRQSQPFRFHRSPL